MLVYIGDCEYSFSKDQLDYMYVNEGREGVVYKYRNKALKIYNKYSSKLRLSECDVEKLKKINTNRFVLPTDTILDSNGEFIGYVMPYYETRNKSFLMNKDILFLKEELKKIKEDIKCLSKQKIDIDDLIVDNMLYDGNIRIIDPGSFAFRENDNVERLFAENTKKFSDFVVDEIFTIEKLSKPAKKRIHDKFLNDDLFDSLEREDDSQTIKQYIRKISR